MSDRSKIIVVTFIVSFPLILGVLVGFLLGTRTADQRHKAIIQATFEPVRDCLTEINYSGRLEGRYWAVSDYVLHQDWEKNKNRHCEVEVGEILHEYLTKD